MEVVLTDSDFRSQVAVQKKLDEFLDTPKGLEIQTIVANFYLKTGFTINNDSITDLLQQLSQGNRSSEFFNAIQKVFGILQQSFIKDIIPQKAGSKTKKRGKNKKNKRGKSCKRGGTGMDIWKQPLAPTHTGTDIIMRLCIQLLFNTFDNNTSTAPPPVPEPDDGKNSTIAFVLIAIIIFINIKGFIHEYYSRKNE